MAAAGLEAWLRDAGTRGVAVAVGFDAGRVADLAASVGADAVFVAPDGLADAARSTLSAATGRRKVLVLDDFDVDDRRVVAALAAYHRRSTPGAPKAVCVPLGGVARDAVPRSWPRFSLATVGDDDDRKRGLRRVDAVLARDVPATVEALYDQHVADPGVVPGGLFENYTRALSDRDPYDVLVAAKVADGFSTADVTHDRCVATIAAGLELAKRFGRRRHGKATKHGTAWSRHATARAKAARTAPLAASMRMPAYDVAWARRIAREI